MCIRDSINAGDGRHEHPTQAMLDMFTIKQHKKDFAKLSVAIVGDILHSRVARSEIHALNILGASEIRIIAPHTLIPKDIEKLGVHIYHDMNDIDTHTYRTTLNNLEGRLAFCYRRKLLLLGPLAATAEP